jgi:transcription initiation factor TFIID subunit 11
LEISEATGCHSATGKSASIAACMLYTDTVQIVNQTLSQSAPASVILAVKSVAKIFAGEMIEGARKVQNEWIGADDLLKDGIRKNMQKLPTPPDDIRQEIMEEEKNLPRGPLEPDHLREALRRYKTKGEGGMVGQLGLWQHQQSS